MVLKNALKIVACGLALWLTTLIFKEAVLESYAALVAAAVILWAVNLAVRPLLKVLMIPIGCLTLGLAYIVLNPLIVWGVTSFMPGIDLGGFWPSAVAAVFVAAATSLLTSGSK